MNYRLIFFKEQLKGVQKGRYFADNLKMYSCLVLTVSEVHRVADKPNENLNTGRYGTPLGHLQQFVLSTFHNIFFRVSMNNREKPAFKQ